MSASSPRDARRAGGPPPSTAPDAVIPFDRRRAAENLLVDRTTSRVSEALGAAGIPHILLKGPAIADWLYGGGEVRPYSDSDLLVAPGDWERATGVLRRLGFRERLGPLAHPRVASPHSQAWGTDDSADADVDLHRSLAGLGAQPQRVWVALSSDTVRTTVARREIAVLSAAGRTLHIALHAAHDQHGKAIVDLGRAVERVPEDTWARAAALAGELDGLAWFSAGLRSLPAGRELAVRLGVAGARSTRASLRAARVPVAEGLHELSVAKGIGARLEILRRELVPTRTFLRWWTPLATRGRAGMAAAYLWRPLYLLWMLPRAALTIRAVRREQRRAPSQA